MDPPQVVRREQVLGLGLGQHSLEKRPRNVTGQQPVAVLGEDCRAPDGIIQTEANETAETGDCTRAAQSSCSSLRAE
jgi:hypothetical protein